MRSKKKWLTRPCDAGWKIRGNFTAYYSWSGYGYNTCDIFLPPGQVIFSHYSVSWQDFFVNLPEYELWKLLEFSIFHCHVNIYKKQLLFYTLPRRVFRDFGDQRLWYLAASRSSTSFPRTKCNEYGVSQMFIMSRPWSSECRLTTLYSVDCSHTLAIIYFGL